MARIVPENAQGRTTGEKEILTLLKKQLSDDFYVRYEPYLNDRYPDFVIFGPTIGVVILEIKDWSKNYIYQFSREHVVVSGDEKRENPQKQVTAYSREIAKQVEVRENGKYKYPINSIIVFMNMTQDEFMAIKDEYSTTSLSDFICPDHTLFSEDIQLLKDSGRSGDLLDLFRSHMKFKPWSFTFSEKDLGALRAVLNTNILIRDNIDSTFKMLSEEQERFSQEIPSDHKLIIGNAGSGKSVVITSQIKYILDRLDDVKILMICFNKVFRDTLRNSLLKDYYYDDGTGQLHIYGSKESSLFDDDYDFIFVDEGQDVEPEIYEDLSKRRCTTTYGYMIVACDGTQNIYNKIFSFNTLNLGFKFDHSHLERLTSNYRCTREILTMAECFLEEKKDLISEGDHEFDSRFTNRANRHRRNGLKPEIKRNMTDEEEYQTIVDKILDLFERGVEPNQIAVFLSKNDKITKLREFGDRKTGIQFIESNEEVNYSSKKITVTSYFNSKGLEYDYVIVGGFSEYPLNNKYAKAIYVVMTRARKELYITYSEASTDKMTIDALNHTWSSMIEVLRYKGQLDTGELRLSAEDLLDYVKCASQIYEHFQGDIVKLIDELKPLIEKTSAVDIQPYMTQIHELMLERDTIKNELENERKNQQQLIDCSKEEKSKSAQLDMVISQLKDQVKTLEETIEKKEQTEQIDLLTAKANERKAKEALTVAEEDKDKYIRKNKRKNLVIVGGLIAVAIFAITSSHMLDKDMWTDKPTEAFTDQVFAEDQNVPEKVVVLDVTIKRIEPGVTSCYIYIKDHETDEITNTFNLPLGSLVTIEQVDDGYGLVIKELLESEELSFNEQTFLIDKDTVIEFCNINAVVNRYNDEETAKELTQYTKYIDDRAKLLFKVDLGKVESLVN